ncbi:tetratricopeptide repeat protein 12-like [Cylas formicarius]|uniref:tetratricopeptide repeat protein 12-like n=1 Tax=Cylas formicarius TaxID=197179 RepID=UPI002958576B|nr:tetratricopeptide repeat protein 12-like [Cylas formicarius]
MERLGQHEEEFTNFMHRVNDVSNIVSKLSSSDKNLQEIGDLEARNFLGESSETIDERDVVLKIRSDKTVINKRNDECSDPNQISKEAFMEAIAKDADRRHQDRITRTERMETFKKQGNLAFRRGNYEKALTLFTKAIGKIKDSTLLYNNRALTYIKLGCYEKARDDLINWALKTNEDCLKSWLLLAKIYHLTEKPQELQDAVREAIARNPEKESFITEYINQFEN